MACPLAGRHDLSVPLQRKELAAERRQVFAASPLAQARADRWRATHPTLARAVEDDGEVCLACLAFPLAQQARIFPNHAACLRLATAHCAEQSNGGVTGRRYLDLAELGGEETPGTMPRRGESVMTLVG